MSAVARLPAQAYVYVIGAVDGPQKIGVAADPDARRALFQTGNAEPLIVADRVEVTRDEAFAVERRAHWILRDRAIRGEWFDCSPADAAEAVRQGLAAARAGEPAPLQDGRTAAISLRTFPSLKRSLEAQAKRDGRTLARYVELALLAHVENAEARG